ncbi:rab-GTPase-TBC domain-containing protein [Nemania sp. FL0916]|nr:rab-GTPase-TBC domain-containing protein [Nemania sp. FL0916]
MSLPLGKAEKDLHGTENQPHEDLDPALRAERNRILEASRDGDIDVLREIAISPGGFYSDNLRSKAWPALLGFNGEITSLNSPGGLHDGWMRLPRHRDEDQVKLDVDRSFVYYPNDESPEELEKKKVELSDLICQTLREQPYLCYFQGYHDICQVILLVLPKPMRPLAMARLSTLRIRDFMLPTLGPAIAQLRLIPDILRAADPELCAHVLSSSSQNNNNNNSNKNNSEPYFALSDTLTMFAHNVQRYSDIARLFDALLARGPVFALYVVARVVLRRRAELLALDPDEPDVLHFVLSKLPADLDLDAVVAEAALLFDAHPPETLSSWQGISRNSVLKSTRKVKDLGVQSLKDGERMFEAQVREMRRAEQRRKLMLLAWRNRALIAAVLVGVSAVCLRKTPAWAGIIEWVTTRLSRS